MMQKRELFRAAYVPGPRDARGRLPRPRHAPSAARLVPGENRVPERATKGRES
jgi:hypothetical protein